MLIKLKNVYLATLAWRLTTNGYGNWELCLCWRIGDVIVVMVKIYIGATEIWFLSFFLLFFLILNFSIDLVQHMQSTQSLNVVVNI